MRGRPDSMWHPPLRRTAGLLVLAMLTAVALEAQLAMEVVSAPTPAPRSYALVVGTDRYLEPSALPPAGASGARNATAIASMFDSAGYVVRVLMNEQATRTGVLTAVRRLAWEVRAEDSAVVYLWGTAVRSAADRGTYWRTYDSRLSLLESGAIRIDHLRELVDGMAARRKLILIDGTFSGEVRTKEFSEARGEPVVELSESSQVMPLAGTTTSAQGSLLAFFAPPAVAGAGSISLASMALGAVRGDADVNRDGQLSVAELASFVDKSRGSSETVRLGTVVQQLGEDWPLTKLVSKDRASRVAAYKERLADWSSRGWLSVKPFVQAATILDNWQSQAKGAATSGHAATQVDRLLQILDSDIGGMEQARGIEKLLSGRKHALLIGIDNYAAKEIGQLRGCREDVVLVRSILEARFDFQPVDMRLLLDSDATRAVILQQLSDLSERVAEGDAVVVYLTGHASQMPGGVEADGLVETFLAHDSRTGGVGDIREDELGALIERISAKTDNVVVILDTVRAAGFADASLSGSGVVYLASCRKNEMSYESWGRDGRAHGAFTWALVEALRTAGWDASYRDIMERIAAEVTGRYPSQHPVAIGGGVDRAVFGPFAAAADSSYLLVTASAGGRVKLRGGHLNGVTAGSQYAIYPPETVHFGSSERQPRVEVVRVSTTEAEATIVAGGGVEPGSRAVEMSHHFPDPVFRVRLEGSETSPVLQQIRAELKNFQHIEVVSSPEVWSDLLLQERQGEVQLLSPVLPGSGGGGRFAEMLGEKRGEGPRAAVRSTDPNVVSKVVALLEQWAKWHNLLAIRNDKSALRAKVEVRSADLEPSSVLGGERGRLKAGSRFEVVVTNASLEPLYMALLDLSSDGSVTVAPKFPIIGPGQTSTLGRFTTFVPEGWESVVDVLKVFATSEPINFEFLRESAVRGRTALGPSERGQRNPLEQLLAAAAIGTTRSAESKSVEARDWTTTEYLIEIVAGDSQAEFSSRIK